MRMDFVARYGSNFTALVNIKAEYLMLWNSCFDDFCSKLDFINRVKAFNDREGSLNK